jgi:hypothetical protein
MNIATCLNTGEKFWDLRRFMVVGERMILTGAGEGPDGNWVSRTGDDSTSDSETDDQEH